MAIPGLVAASNLADTENKEAVWDNLGNGIESVVLATNFIPNSTMVGAVVGTPGTFPTYWVRNFNSDVGGDPSSSLFVEVVGTGVDDEIVYLDVRLFGSLPNFNGTRELQVVIVGGNVIPAKQGQTWTNSIYTKIMAGSPSSIENLVLFTIGTNGMDYIDVTSTIINFPSFTGPLSECRTFQAVTFDQAQTAFIFSQFSIYFPYGAHTIDFTVRIGMPQLERGEYLTPPIATTNGPASALATVSLSIKGNDILELTGAQLAATSDFVRIKDLVTPAQPRLTAAAANVASGIALRDNALLKVSPSSEGDYFLSRGTLDGQSLRVNGLNIASLSGSPFSGSTASCPLLISSFAAPTNLRINNAMASGTLAFPERAIPIETDQFILYAKAGQG